MRTSRHLTSNTPIHWAAWLGCTGGITIVGYLIGSGIPVFDGLISLVGAVFATLMMFQPMGFMWLYDNWHKDRTTMWKAGVAWAIFNIVMGTFITIGKLGSSDCRISPMLTSSIGGTYGSVLGIINSKDRTSPWSCADNSNST